MKAKEREGMDVNVAKRGEAMKIVMKVMEITVMEMTVMLEGIRGNRKPKNKGEWVKKEVMHASEITKLGYWREIVDKIGK